jgi:hypothetical protein
MIHSLRDATTAAAIAMCRANRPECTCRKTPDECVSAVRRYSIPAAAVLTALNRKGYVHDRP